MKKYLVSIISILLLGSCLHGQAADQKVGMTGVKFLSVPVGARGVAMGEAFVGIVDDGSAVFWNVAAITKLTGHNVFAASTQWPAGISFKAAAANIDVGRVGKISLHYRMMDVGAMRVRTAYAPDGTGEMFNVQSISAGMGWAKNLTDHFAMGLNVKYIREDYAGLIADGFAIDVGSLYDTGWRGMRIGMSMTNFGSDIAFDGTYRQWYNIEEVGQVTDYDEFSLPLTFRFGITYDALTMNNSKLVLAVDAIHPPDNKEVINLGGEFTMMKMIAFRGGYRLGIDEGGLSFGVGLNVPYINASFDYSYSDFGLLGNIQHISLGLDI